MLPGLFHGVIAQSGVATAPYSVYARDESIDFHQYVRDVGRLFLCSGRGWGSTTPLQDVIACLRQVPQTDIIAQRGNVREEQFDLSSPNHLTCDLIVTFYSTVHHRSSVGLDKAKKASIQ